MQEFEWDDNKRKINLEKHEIDFIDATAVFDDPLRLECEILKSNEIRYQVLGMVEGLVLFVVYTQRVGKIRLISARRASKNERKIYETSR